MCRILPASFPGTPMADQTVATRVTSLAQNGRAQGSMRMPRASTLPHPAAVEVMPRYARQPAIVDTWQECDLPNDVHADIGAVVSERQCWRWDVGRLPSNAPAGNRTAVWMIWSAIGSMSASWECGRTPGTGFVIQPAEPSIMVRKVR